MAKSITQYILDVLFSVIDEGIHVIDNNAKTVYYNNSMARLEELDKDKVLNKNFNSIFPSLNEETSTLLKSLKTGQPITDKIQTYVNNQGRVITTINTTVPIKADGKILGALEIARDITVLTQMSQKLVLLQRKVKQDTSKCFFAFKDIVGKSAKLKEALRLAEKVASSSSTVLIIGETGTGKELFAQGIHNNSPRRNKPFIAQNCAALPESLLEGLLFGTTKGTFTGAADRPGIFEMADGGTLLLDELNSMGPNLQAKLLRVLQNSIVRRVGGDKDIHVNVRIIATTNTDPKELIRNGELRPDLYYRLNTFPIEVPALRERKEDIPLLVNHFIAKYNKILGSRIKKASPEIDNLFNEYNWPGNVRELENAIQASANIAVTDEILRPEHLPQNILRVLAQSNNCNTKRATEYNYQIPFEEYLEQIEKEVLEKTLVENNYNISQAARKLSIKRQLLQYKIKKYKLQLHH